ncbi:MAG: TonB-dependent receptor [Steroidobacteraceae bacterium]
MNTANSHLARMSMPWRIVSLSTLVLTQQAFAQSSDFNQLEEIIVTAQKRSENVQDVPIAMQAFSAEELQDARVTQLTDVTQMAPNLNIVVQNSLSQHVVIRGVGTNEFFGNAPSSVGMYMDEVTMNSSYMSTLGLFDMERIEVLRGPQNSLFGRNTTGGAINYITHQPQINGDTDGYLLATYGRHNLAEVEAAGTLAGGNTALRLAGMFHSREGIWNNLDDGDDHYGDESRYSLRATFAWQPSEATRVTLSAHHARDNGEAQPQKMAGALSPTAPPLRINDLAPFTRNIDWVHPNNVAGLVNIEGFDRHTDRWNDVYIGGSQRADLHVDGGYLKLQHDLNAATLTSITSGDATHAWYEEDNTGNGNVRGGPNTDVLIIDMDQQYSQFTQELRLASSDDKARFRWITGLYYLQENATLAQDIRFGANGFPGAHPSAVGITPPTLFDVIPNPYANTVSFSIAEMRDRSYSAYGQSDLAFTDKTTLTVGLRFTRDDKGNPYYYAGAFDKTNANPATYYDKALLQRLAAGLPNCIPKSNPAYIPFTRCADVNTSRENLKTNQLGGKVGLEFRLSPSLMYYGSYSRGFKSGKFDMEFLHTDDTPFPQRPLEPEVLNVFELGMKSTFQQSLLFNVALFYNIWKDQQVFNVGVNGPEFFNLPESRIYGAELELQWVPATNWLLTGSVGLLHTEITDVTGIDFDLHQGDFQKGHELPLSPPTTATGAVEKRINLGTKSLRLRADARYQSTSKVKFSPQVPIDEYDSHFEVNARATFSYGSMQQHELSLFADNLTNEKYCREIQDLRGVSGSFYCVPNDGMTQWGVQARMSF